MNTTAKIRKLTVKVGGRPWVARSHSWEPYQFTVKSWVRA